MADRLHLDEIFLSLQGEGAGVGEPQLFLRLGGCPLRCRYCDTPRSWTRQPEFELHIPAGTERRPNPLDAPALDAALAELAAAHGADPARLTLSVTGGEPLAQAGFLAAWLPGWPGRRVLETAGLWPERLRELLPAVDAVSLDWKLAATLDRGEAAADALGCVEVCEAAGAEWWLKLVVSAEVAEEEVRAVWTTLGGRGLRRPLYLQPETPAPGRPAPPAAGTLMRWALAGVPHGLDVRVLPQIHPALGIR